MKVFLSWSGERSEYLAECFKDWLPSVLQNINPYMSKKDIGLGDRWADNIETNLREHNYGLVFVTPENIDAPWINFEAGALSKDLQSRLIPMIYDGDITLLSDSPLKQFQSQKTFEENSIKNLLIELNNSFPDDIRISNSILEGSFKKWWPDLEESIGKVPGTKNVASDSEEEAGTFEKQALTTVIKKIEVIEKSLKMSPSSNVECAEILKKISRKIERVIAFDGRAINLLRKTNNNMELERDEQTIQLEDFLFRSYSIAKEIRPEISKLLDLI